MSQMSKSGQTPVLLLKTRSSPHDGYEEYFNATANGPFRPIFVPVLEHKLKEDTLHLLHSTVTVGGFSTNYGWRPQYGGIIFTSQRAVEAFGMIVQSVRTRTNEIDKLLPPELPLYVVGPATARGLRALDLKCNILGEECGNGEALAEFILQHYNDLPAQKQMLGGLPLLFLVGEKRRDIIPTTLQSPELSPQQRIGVHEVVVYETGEMPNFKSDFTYRWYQNARTGSTSQWIVVFSPTGCQAVLSSLGMLDELTGKVKQGALLPRNTHIATIGPTTRDYLIQEFGYEPDVCAPTPSPEGVGIAIRSFQGV